jgi:glycosyltransferase involved in cell wall biosynthesis
VNVVIIGNLFTYPDFSAAAASARVFAYARGLVANDVRPVIITLANVYGHEAPIQDHGFKSFVALKRNARSNYFLARRYFRIKKYFNVIGMIRAQAKAAGPIRAVILYSRSPWLMLYVRLLAHYHSAKLLLEVTEHPHNDFWRYSPWKVLLPAIYRYAIDGFICISKSLQTFCEHYKNRKARIIVIPPIVFPENDAAGPNALGDGEYLLYSGSLSFRRDGIDNLLKAFQLLGVKYPGLKLVLGGQWLDQETKQRTYALVEVLKLGEKVVFLDFLPKAEIQAYIQQAKILCIARNKNKQTAAAFPTKLAEYLASGRPLITTAVGDIPAYLTDGVNAFLVEPGNAQALADKMAFVLENYPNALQVAAQGKELAMANFGSRQNVKRLIEFINELK